MGSRGTIEALRGCSEQRLQHRVCIASRHVEYDALSTLHEQCWSHRFPPQCRSVCPVCVLQSASVWCETTMVIGRRDISRSSKFSLRCDLAKLDCGWGGMLHKCSPKRKWPVCICAFPYVRMACVLCVCPSTFATAVEGRFVACTKAIFPLTLAANAVLRSIWARPLLFASWSRSFDCWRHARKSKERRR